MKKISCPHCHQEIELEIHVVKETRDVQKTRNLDKSILEKIRQGIPVTSGGDKEITNALTRLRRNALIRNEGTRKNPKWVIVEPSPAVSIYEIPSWATDKINELREGTW